MLSSGELLNLLHDVQAAIELGSPSALERVLDLIDPIVEKLEDQEREDRALPF
jgi:hypothetical protein